MDVGMFQNLWMQKKPTPWVFRERLRSMLRHLAVVNGPLGYNLVAGFSDGLWMVASSEVDLKIKWPPENLQMNVFFGSIMVYLFSCQIFFSEVLLGLLLSNLSFSGTTTASASFLLKPREVRKRSLRKPTAFAWQKCQHICESICPEMRWGSLEVK